MCRAIISARHHCMQRTMAGRVTAAVQSLRRAMAACGALAEEWTAEAEGCEAVARGGSGSRSRVQLLLEEVFTCHEACNTVHASPAVSVEASVHVERSFLWLVSAARSISTRQ